MIHSIKMFNLLAQSKSRIKIKISAYDYIPVFISKCEFLKIIFAGVFFWGGSS